MRLGFFTMPLHPPGSDVAQTLADDLEQIDWSNFPVSVLRSGLRCSITSANLAASFAQAGKRTILVDGDFRHPTLHTLFGLPNEGTLEAIRLCARLEGVLTDPVYEGKSMHGMIDKVRKGEFPPGSKVLYAHLGGVPALSAYSFIFRDG